ncbi:glycoside hydrolase family 16 protein [Nemania sp. FL0916]|nr:glycoside hydrolase family 16 protein [Nemania sp. FL0916]
MANLSLQTLLFVVLQVLDRVSGLQEVSDGQCGCYMTNSTDKDFFTTHSFFDFRELSQYARVPAPIADPYDSTDADATSNYFLDKDWTDVWGIQSWNNSDSVEAGTVPTLLVNSPNNIYIEKNTDENPSSDTYMTMRTLRFKDYQSTAEFESISKAYHFLSVRMYARTIGGPGAVTAMFTYRDDGDGTQLTSVQESDLEIRTRDPKDKVQYTNQPSYTKDGDDIPAATRNVTTPVQADWTQWTIHRLDWSPKETTWYLDGNPAASISFQVPRDPSQIIFNTWSDGGDWSGNMTVGDAAYLQIQWIEVVYNSTGNEKTTDKRSESMARSQLDVKRAEGHCKNICSIDDTPTLGTPVLIQSAASRVSDHIFGLSVTYIWIPLLLVTFLI